MSNSGRIHKSKKTVPCTIPQAFGNRRSALKALANKPGSAALDAYQCDWCRRWHLGRRAGDGEQ